MVQIVKLLQTTCFPKKSNLRLVYNNYSLYHSIISVYPQTSNIKITNDKPLSRYSLQSNNKLLSEYPREHTKRTMGNRAFCATAPRIMEHSAK